MVERKEQFNSDSSRPVLGCDPELFIADKNGRIVGAERVIPQEGLGAVPGSQPPRVVLDGVQVELHPSTSTCRQSLGYFIGRTFLSLRDALKAKPGYQVSFEPVVEVSAKELSELSDAARILGCSPSFNGLRPDAKVKVSKRNERLRSAGGHLHFGLGDARRSRIHQNKAETRQLVNLFDILVGLPSVLLDRAPGQERRRLIYGRANEYRLPGHGIEYRTLSNFWLRHYVLMSFVFAQGRQAISIHHYHSKLAAHLQKILPAAKVERAINRNSLGLALPLWNRLKGFYRDHGNECYSGLAASNLTQFDALASDIRDFGIEAVFPTNPMDSWCGIESKGLGAGFEAFINGYKSKAKELKKAA